MAKLTRRKLLCATAPLAAAPLGAKIVLGGEAEAAVTTTRPTTTRRTERRRRTWAGRISGTRR